MKELSRLKEAGPMTEDEAMEDELMMDEEAEMGEAGVDLMSAGDDELIAELEARGYKISKGDAEKEAPEAPELGEEEDDMMLDDL
jgi:hypothetical protein